MNEQLFKGFYGGPSLRLIMELEKSKSMLQTRPELCLPGTILRRRPSAWFDRTLPEGRGCGFESRQGVPPGFAAHAYAFLSSVIFRLPSASRSMLDVVVVPIRIFLDHKSSFFCLTNRRRRSF